MRFKDCKGWYVPWICGFCVAKRKCHKVMDKNDNMRKKKR